MTTFIADAVIAAVQAAVPGRPVSDGQVLARPDPKGHVVVYCSEGKVLRESVGADTDVRQVDWQVSSFGPVRQTSGWLSRTITDYLMAHGVDVEGWSHGVVVHEMSRRASSDDDVPEYNTAMAVDQYSMLLAKVL